MFSRITFPLITLFWLTMTYLLWRSEYVGQNQVGSNVPVELVWRKILTAPDNSSLQMMHGDHKVGYCRWASNIGLDLAAARMLADDAPPEGMAGAPANYRLDFEGNVAVDGLPGRLKFDSEIKLSSSNTWQEVHVRLKIGSEAWEVHASAALQTVQLLTSDRRGGIESKSEREFKFSELQDPAALMQEFNLPASFGMLGMLGPLPGGQKGDLSLGVHWTARNDWIKIGQTSVRAYRLEATVLERYRMRIIVSQVGEILLVDLPDGWRLENEQLISL